MAGWLKRRGEVTRTWCCLLISSLTFGSPRLPGTEGVMPSALGRKVTEPLHAQLTRLGVHRTRQTSVGSYFLAVCAQFKDEDGILAEWLDHYLAGGVEHFFLIDDGSSDRSRSVLEPYIHSGLVTLMVDIRKDHNPPVSMTDRYNLLFKPFHYLTTWMIHVDLDEFMYGRKISLTEFLKDVKPTLGEIRVPWKQFGSSGHVHKPKASLVDSLLHRAAFAVNMSMYVHTKPIFRVAALVREEAHYAQLRPEYTSGFALIDGTVAPDLPGWPLDSLNRLEWMPLNDEQILDELGIHLNHYTTRYKDWFMAVKATRGIADREVSPYNEEYFTAYDCNDILDDELAHKQP